MSSFLNISTKTMVILIVYLMLVYTTVSAFGFVSGGFQGVVIPENPMINYKMADDNDTTPLQSGSSAGFWGIVIGAIVGVIVGIVFPPAGVGLGYAIAFGAGAGATILGSVGFVYGWATDEYNIEMPFDGFLRAVQSFFGSIVTLFVYIFGFLSFGLIVGVIELPSYLQWLLFIMVVPVWFLLIVWLAGLGIESWKAIKPRILG